MIVVSFLLTLGPLWIVYRWATESFPWLAARKLWFAAALATPVGLELATRELEVRAHSVAAGVFDSLLIVLLVTVDLASVPILFLRLSSWAVARRAASARALTPERANDATMTRRQVVDGAGGLALFGVTGSMLGWGAVRGRHEFELCEVPVRIAGLPRALDGYVIAQVSDIHTGLYVGERELDEGFELVRAARPDLIVVTGDLVDFDPTFAPLVARRLAALPSRDGVAAVLGNHDYYTGAGQVAAALRAAGVDLLVDDGRRIRSGDGGGFALLGVDDKSSKRYGRSGPRLDRALSMVPPDVPRILLSHQPPTVEYWAGQVALQLSGHTHGGQINPGGYRLADVWFKYVAGPYAVAGTTLYVNRGFGTVGPPSRVGSRPEVTRIVLVSA